MKPILVFIDSFGESLSATPDCSTLFEVCGLRKGAASWNPLLEKLTGLGWGGAGQVSRLCVVADLGEAESRRRLEELSARLQERFHRSADDAYLILPETGGDAAVLRGGSPWKKIFVLARHFNRDQAVEPASRVLAVHGKPELESLIHRPGAPGVVHALAWQFQAPGKPAVGRDASDLLPEALDAIDILIEDLKNSVSSMLKMVESLRKKDLDLYEKAIPPIKDMVAHLGAGDFKPESVDWASCLKSLPHGLEAQGRLALSLAGKEIDTAQLSALVASLPAPKGDEKWKLEIDVVDALLKNFVEVRVPSKLEMIDPIFREKISSNCLRLLRAFDSPLIRRRMLHSLLHFLLAGSLSGEDHLELARGELRRHLQEARGGGAFLILPKDTVEKRQQTELQSWIEQVMGIPCGIVPTQEKDAWLYIEMPFESRPGAFLPAPQALPASSFSAFSPEEVIEGEPLPAVDPPADREAEPLPLPASLPPPPITVLPAPVAPAVMSRRCPDCGISLSEPRLILAPEREAGSRNGSRPRKTCPTCGRLNARAWWVCWNHGKAPLFVSNDKVRCPDCILCHHEDPDRFPLSRISVKPDYKEPAHCPNCENVRLRDPGHPIFEIPEDLLKFYRDGVNGHDGAHFKAAVRKAGLLGDCYCPNCGTLLIPVDHRKSETTLPS